MSPTNANFRKDPIPYWIYGLSLLVLAILTFQVVSGLFSPNMMFGTFDAGPAANSKVLMTLTGRNVVMIVVTLLALKSQNAMILAFTFLMHFARETWDMIMVPFYDGFTGSGIGQMAVFLLVFLVPYIVALRKLRSLAMRD